MATYTKEQFQQILKTILPNNIYSIVVNFSDVQNTDLLRDLPTTENRIIILVIDIKGYVLIYVDVVESTVHLYTSNNETLSPGFLKYFEERTTNHNQKHLTTVQHKIGRIPPGMEGPTILHMAELISNGFLEFVGINITDNIKKYKDILNGSRTNQNYRYDNNMNSDRSRDGGGGRGYNRGRGRGYNNDKGRGRGRGYSNDRGRDTSRGRDRSRGSNRSCGRGYRNNRGRGRDRGYSNNRDRSRSRGRGRGRRNMNTTRSNYNLRRR